MALGNYGLALNGAASDLSITVAGTTICTAITGLTGMLALRVALDFVWGSGGTSVKVYVQTSDDGNVWDDIACWAVATASASKRWNFSALTPVITPVTPTDGAMADNTAQDGILGMRVRLKVVVTGTYAGSTLLRARMTAR